MARGASQTIKKKGGRRNAELLVRFRDGVSLQDKQALVTSLGAKNARRLSGASFVYKIVLQPSQDVEAVAAQLILNPIIKLAEPNYLISKDEVVPDDPRFTEQWALKNTGTNGKQSGADISVTDAWETSAGATSTVIAVIDSGIDFTHPDLRNNQWTNPLEGNKVNGRDEDHNGFTDDLRGWDWVTGSAVIRDGEGHGTKMAGIIAAEGNNREGIAGVMWRARLMSLRALDQTGTGDVAMTGGTPQTPYYPASFKLPNVIAVAATDSSNRLADWSNRSANGIQIAAPGMDILTTTMGGGYELASGSSASTALVAGVAGLVRTLRPRLTAERTREMTVKGARRLPELEGQVSSTGVLNAAGALGVINTLPPDEGKDEASESANGGNGRGQERGVNGNGNGGENGNAEPAAKLGTPGSNLPNLDDLKRKDREKPETAPPIPSTMCPPRNPRCQPTAENKPSQQEQDTPQLSSSSPVALLAQNSGYGLPGFLRENYLPMISDALSLLRMKDGIYDSGAERASAYARFARKGTALSTALAPQSSTLFATGFEPGQTQPNWYDSPDYISNIGGYCCGLTSSQSSPRTGEPGVDLISRNYNWSLPLVSLPGRSGLDLGLSLSYNSLVWTRSGLTIKYDADRGFPGPGFRLGFPVIHQRYVNAQGINSYLLILISGARVELRQVGSSNVYEAADSSYMQLVDNGSSLILRTTDGTQLSYGLSNGEYQCVQIKDRNGNFITATYNGMGRITSVTDTLGRVIAFNYDAYQNLISITQPWTREIPNGATSETHTWASFGWGSLNIQTSFAGDRTGRYQLRPWPFTGARQPDQRQAIQRK